MKSNLKILAFMYEFDNQYMLIDDFRVHFPRAFDQGVMEDILQSLNKDGLVDITKYKADSVVGSIKLPDDYKPKVGDEIELVYRLTAAGAILVESRKETKINRRLSVGGFIISLFALGFSVIPNIKPEPVQKLIPPVQSDTLTRQKVQPVTELDTL